MTHLNPTDDVLQRTLTEAQTIAVVGASNNPERASHGVMKALLAAGYRVVPVHPTEAHVLGHKAYARLADVPVPVDIVDVFVRADAVGPIADDAIAIGAKALWLQLGVVNDDAAARAAQAGLLVAMDLCIAVTHRRLHVLPKRHLARVDTLPPPAAGFLGDGHTAVEVLTPSALAQSDPFVLLMDDRIDTGPVKRQLGGAHPHAGLETVTLVLEGTVDDRDEGPLSAGDALFMSAGSGVIHSEQIEFQGKARVLQLWVRLPAKDRDSAPGFERITRQSLPTLRAPGVDVALYSGHTGALRSPTKNHAPVTLLDVKLEPGRHHDLVLPAEQSGFLYVIEGALAGGPAGTPARQGQIAWLDAPRSVGESVLRLAALEDGARVIVYAGEPQREPLVHYGPFVAGSLDDIEVLFRRFRAGRFPLLSELQASARAN